MLSGVALVVFGAGLILSNPDRETLPRPVWAGRSGSGRFAGSGPLFEIAIHVADDSKWFASFLGVTVDRDGM